MSLERYSYTVQDGLCYIHDVANELPRLVLEDHKIARDLVYFLNQQQTHMKDMERLFDENVDIESYRTMMYNELLGILVEEAENYRNWKTRRLGSTMFKDNIAVRVLDILAHDLGLLKFGQDLESVKFETSYRGDDCD